MKYRFKLSTVFFLVLFLCNCGQNLTSDEISEIKEILNIYHEATFTYVMLDIESKDQLYHPDALWPGGEQIKILVVKPDYSIEDISKEKDNINLMNPKLEDIITVKVIYNKVLRYNADSIEKQTGSYEKIFYLSNTDKGWKILHMSNPALHITTYSSFLRWANEKLTTDKIEQINDFVSDS